VKGVVYTDFIMKKGYGGFPTPGEWCDLIETDTFVGSRVRFIAPAENSNSCTSEWGIGSDTQVYTQKEFVLNFAPYREQGNWEVTIPVQLTIRRPNDACLSNVVDTLVSVERNLVFRRKAISFYEIDHDTFELKGYYENKPELEVVLRIWLLPDGEKFRKYNGPTLLATGVPGFDTLLWYPTNCGGDGCANYK